MKAARILYHHRTRADDGQSVHIEELISAFRLQGQEVKIIGPARLAAISRHMQRSLLPKALYELAELAFSAVEFARLYRAALRMKPDLIYQRANLHMLGAIWVARLLGVPLFVEVNAPLAWERGKSPGLAWPGLARWSERYLWRQADMVLPVTEVLAQQLVATGVSRERIAVIANGVNRARFPVADRQAAKRMVGLSGRLVLGFVGYVRDWHGLEQVIDLLAEDPALAAAHLIVVGDGPARPALTARAERLGVTSRVFFTGTVARDDVARIAGAFDIALQPDVTSYASPLKLFEYMALGQAIVAPDMPNIREILSDGDNALLFAPGNFPAFAQAVGRLAGDAALRERLGSAAADDILRKDLTWEGNARRIAALLYKLRPSPELDRPLLTDPDPV